MTEANINNLIGAIAVIAVCGMICYLIIKGKL